MKRVDWNNYFYSHYRPIESQWGRKDLQKYRKWYAHWISYIKHQFGFTFRGKTALELGCGIGAVCSLLYDEGCEVTGSDIAEAMVQSARLVNPKVLFLVYDVTRPFPKKQRFDFVFAFEVLEHIDDIDRALSHIKTILAPGGWFIASTPYPYGKNMVDPTHVNVHHPEFWKSRLEKLGFTSVKTSPMSFFPVIWRLPFSLQRVLPRYIPNKYFVSTTLLLARKPLL